MNPEMEDDKPSSELFNALSRYLRKTIWRPWLRANMNNFSVYKDGKYSDLTVVCGERTYRAHKVLLCTRSQFFAKACDGGFLVRGNGSYQFE